MKIIRRLCEHFLDFRRKMRVCSPYKYRNIRKKAPSECLKTKLPKVMAAEEKM